MARKPDRKGGEKRRPAGLSPEDAELWARVAASVDARLPERPPPDAFRRMTENAARDASRKGEGRHLSSPKSNRRTLKAAAPTTGQRPKGVVSTGGPSGPGAGRPAPGATLDRRTRQRLMRGQVEIEARLDLHGHGVELARRELRAFIMACRMRGLRTVLVITGKGAAPFARHTLHGRDHWHAPERKGQLRRLVPEWLSEPELARHVAGFQPAHPRHGGGGAFYVRLRRRDRGG